MHTKRSILRLIKKISPKVYIKILYKHKFGKSLDLDNPIGINEKILWMIFNWQHPLIIICADKYKVRDYVQEKGLAKLLPKLYGVWNDADSIDWNKLPQKIVLKCNHGCHMNIISNNLKREDLSQIKGKLNKWVHTPFESPGYEPHYSYIPPKIIAEEYISSIDGKNVPSDYKFYCFYGKPEYIMACSDREDNGRAIYEYYDLKWDDMGIGKLPNMKTISKPNTLKKMIDYAEILSKDFPFVRVDFYDGIDDPVFSELTFTPNYGMDPDYSEEGNIVAGKSFVLPEKYPFHFEER